MKLITEQAGPVHVTATARLCVDAVGGLHACATAATAWGEVIGYLVTYGAPEGFQARLNSTLIELDNALRPLRTLAGQPETDGPGAVTEDSESATAGPQDAVEATEAPAGDLPTPPSPEPPPPVVAVASSPMPTAPVGAPPMAPPVVHRLPEVDDDGCRCVLSATGPGFSISGLIEFLGRSGKSGTLRMATGGDVFTLRLVDGQLVHAECEQRPPNERLGEILVSRGAMDSTRLHRLLELCSSGWDDDRVRLGELLARENLISETELCDALSEQVRRLFARLFAGEGHWFGFYEGLPSYPRLHVQLRLMELLLDSSRVYDESLRTGPPPGDDAAADDTAGGDAADAARADDVPTDDPVAAALAEASDLRRSRGLASLWD